METSRISNLSKAPDDMQHLRQVLKKSQKSGDNEKAGWSLVHMASVLRRRRMLTSAANLLDKAKSEFSNCKSKFGMACALHELSVINQELGRNTLALDLAYKATRLFEESKKTLELGWSYENLSTIHFKLFHRPEILAYAQKARSIFSDLKSKVGLAWNSCHLGGLYYDNGLYRQAEQNYKEALEIFLKLKDKEGLSSTYLGLGMVLGHRFEFKNALDVLKKAKRYFKDLQSRDGFGWCLLHEASIKRKLGKLNESSELTQKALKIFSPLRQEIGVAACLYQQGQLLRDRGRFVKAWHTIREAYNLHTDLGNKKGMGWTAIELGKTYLDLNDTDHAKVYFIKAKTLAEQWDSGPLKAEALRNLARIDRENGLIQKAIESLKKVQELSSSFGRFQTDIEINLELARCYLLIGDRESVQSLLWEAESIQIKHDLEIMKPAIKNLWGEMFLVTGKKKEAEQAWNEGLESATKMKLIRDRAEALIGLIQLDWNVATLGKIEKEIRYLGCRKLKAKFLLLKGQMLWGRQGVIDVRVLNQSFNVMRGSQLLLLERQALSALSHFYQDAKALKEKEIVDEQNKNLLKNGPVDLYLIQPPPDPAPSFLISLAS